MAKIKSNLIIDDNFFLNLEKSAVAAEAKVEVLKLTMESLKVSADKTKKALESSVPKNNAGLKKHNELVKTSNDITKAQVQTTKQLERARLSELKLQKDREKAFDRFEKKQAQNAKAEKARNDRQVKAAQKLRKSTVDNSNAYKVLAKRTKSAGDRLKRLSAQHGINSAQAKKAAVTYNRLNKRLLAINRSAKKSSGSLGKFGGILASGLGSLGITAGLAGVVAGASALISIFSDFEKANSNLKAVLGATNEEMELLSDNAKELGSVTAFTATEVTGLQTSFAKLGFPTSEILLMTESTLNAAAAMGSGLDEQAALTGATLKAFGLSASSAGRVNDVLAKSTSASALDFQKLNSSMSTIAPVAKAFGFSVEGTTALLGSLSDAGFDASSAATSTRNILLNLADSNGKLAKSLKDPVTDLPSLVKGLKQLKSEGIDLGEALNLTDKRSVAAFQTFLEGTDDVLALNTALEEAGGTAQEMADTQLDNLAGSVTKLGSAWEGFILSLEDGSGAISRFLRGIVDDLSSLLTGIRMLSDDSTKFSDKLRLVFNGAAASVNSLLLPFRKLAEAIDLLTGSNIAEKIKIPELRLIATDAAALTTEFKKLTQEQIRNKATAKEIVSRYAQIGLTGEEAFEAYKKLLITTEEMTVVNNKNTKSIGKQGKAIRELTGLIEIQSKVVQDLQTDLVRATSEEEIFSISFEIKFEKEELERLKRIASSTREEFEKQQVDLIEDGTERQIAQLKQRHDKLIKLIQSNSKTTEEERARLTAEAERDFEDKSTDLEIKKGQDAIKRQEDLAKAEFEIKRSGFKTEEDFEKEKAAQFTAIRKKAIDEEIALLKVANQEKDQLRITQLEAEKEGLFEFQENAEINLDAVKKAIQLTEDIIVKSIDNRIKEINKEREAHLTSVDDFKQAARDGNIVAKESLAEEQILAEQAEAKAADLEKQKQNILLVTAVLKAFATELESGKTTGEALTSAITSTTVLQQFAGALPAFLEGTEDTGEHGAGIDGKGGFHAVLHSGEGVVTKELNKKKLAAGMTNEQMVDNAVNYKAMFEDKRVGNMMGDTQLIASANGVDMSGVEAQLKEVKRAIISKPENNIELGRITQAAMTIRETTKRGNRTTNNRFKVN